MKTINKSYLINAPVEEVWDALTNPVTIEKWGGGPAKMSDKQNFNFELWGGEIWGKNLDVIPNKKLVQEWWSKGELKDKPSKVTFTLTSKNANTELEMVQTHIPDEFEKQLNDGWRDFYLVPIKKLLESSI